VLLKLGAAAPQGAMRYLSFLKKYFYIIDPFKKLNKLVTKTQTIGIGKPVQKLAIRFVATEHFWISLQYRSRIFLQVKEFGLLY
jgi:hypothetical protein